MTAAGLIGPGIEKEALEFRVPRACRIFIRVAKRSFRKTVEELVESKDFSHLSTITGVDAGKHIEVIYHLARKGVVLSLKVRVTKENPDLPTIVDLIPGSALYEREVHELLGVDFKGNPDLSPLLLPDGWPSDIHPLRREWSPERVRERMGEA